MRLKMDFRVQQSVNNFGFLAKQYFPKWNSAPSKTFTNPGLGQIAPLYRFYAPLTTKKSFPNEVVMKIDSEDIPPMTGTGVVEPNISDTKEGDNEVKSHKLSDGVLYSFMHPKIETDKIVFELPKKEKKRSALNSGPEPKKAKIAKNMSHKFQFM